MVQIKLAYSPLSYVNTPYLFGAFVLFSIISGSLITTLITIALAGIATFAAIHFLNLKLPVGGDDAVLMTGCGAGIGADAASYLARKGYTIYAGVRKQTNADMIKSQHRLIEPIILDVQKQTDIDSAVTEIKQRLQAGNKKLVPLINNAGMGQYSPIELISQESFHAQYEIIVFGPVLLTQAFLPVLRRYASKARTARVINMSSIGGRLTAPNNGAYTSTESISDALRLEQNKFHVDVVLVEPGFVHTNLQETAREAQVKTIEAAKTNNRYGVEHEVLSHYEKAVKLTTDMTDKVPMAMPNVVSEQIYSAVADSRPLTRYLAGYDAQLVPILTKLPNRIFDSVFGRLLA